MQSFCVVFVFCVLFFPFITNAAVSYSLLGTNTYAGGGTNTISTTGSVSWSAGDVLIMTFSSNQFYTFNATGSVCDGFYTISGTPNVIWSGVACGQTSNTRNTLVLKGIANASGSGTITATQVSGSFADMVFSVVKISGLQTDTPIINASINGDYTNPEAISFPKTVSGSSYLGIVTTEGNTTFTPFTGWTELSDVFSGSSVSQTVNYRTTYDTTTSCGATAATESFSTIVCLEIGDPPKSSNIIKSPNNLGLMGYWSMNEGAGTIVGDSSGNNYTGAFVNSPTWTNGKIGKALNFNVGTNDAVALPTQASVKGLSRASVSVWFKANDVSGLYDLYTEPIAANQTTRFSLRISSGSLLFTGRDQDGGGDLVTWVTGPTVSANQWYHVVAVFDSITDVHAIYVNGVQAASNSVAVSAFLNSAPFTNPLIGANPVGGEVVSGIIDEVRLYNRALSASEIATLYKSSVTTHRQISNQGLIAYWPMNEGTSTSVGDFSGNGNNGSIGLIGNPWVNGKIGKGLLVFRSAITGTNNNTLDITSNTYTVSVWLKRASNSATGQIFHYGSGGVGGYGISIGTSADGPVCTTNQINLTRFNSTNYCFGSFPADTNWHHLVVVQDSMGISGYVDGVLSGTDPNTSGPISAGLAPFGIAEGTNGMTSWKGYVDDMRIYNRALSATEAASLYRVSERVMNASQNNKVTNGLVGLWSFNGQDVDWASAIAYDRSGQGNNGTMSNMSKSASIDVGKVGQALRFDPNTYITIPAHASLRPTTNLTVSAWVKSTHNIGSVYERIFDQNYGKGFVLCLTGAVTANASVIGAPMIAMGSNGGADAMLLGGTTDISNDNTWHLVTGTFDNGLMKIYVDGVLENSATASFSTVLYNPNDPTIGRNNSTDSNTEHFIGPIDEVRLYNRTLTATEILQLYRASR